MARTSEPTRLESSLGDWLELQSQLLAVQAARLVLGPLDAPPGVVMLSWPSNPQVTRRLSSTVDFAREQGKLAVLEPSVAGGAVYPTTELAAPIVHRGRALGAFGVSVRDVRRDEIKALADRLAVALRLLGVLVDSLVEREHLAIRIGLAGLLLDRERVAESSHALCAELARRLGCERVALGLREQKRMRVVALSSGLRFAPETEAVRDLVACMEEAADQDVALEVPSVPGSSSGVTRAQEQLLRSSGAGTVRTVPLAAHGRSAGAITCEWSRVRVVDRALRAVLEDAAALSGPVLECLSRAEAGPIDRLRSALDGLRERHFGAHPQLARALFACTAAALLTLALYPSEYRISARATLEGRVQRALVAPVDGFLEQASARAGDVVRTGDVLARLDDRDLRLERRKLQGQLARLEKEHREALAGQDRTRISILRAQLDQAAAELELAEEQLGRTRVVAPFDGVVLEGDLESALGSPVDRGSVLFELAPLAGYRIILQVDERDIADLAVGQEGRLALSALPGRRLPLRVERITPMTTVEDGRSVFRVESVLVEPAADLRPGMEGLAKIDVGRRGLLWIWTHGLFDWLRLRAWSFLP